MPATTMFWRKDTWEQWLLPRDNSIGSAVLLLVMVAEELFTIVCKEEDAHLHLQVIESILNMDLMITGSF